MPTSNWTNDEECKIAAYIAERVCSKAAGRLEDECCKNLPRDVYFIGNLRPQGDPDSPTSGLPDEMMNKLSPMAFGAEFQVLPSLEEVIVDVIVRWACYYRVFPTLQEQCSHQSIREPIEEIGEANAQDVPSLEISSPDEEPDIVDDVDGTELVLVSQPESSSIPPRNRRGRSSSDSMFIRFRKILCTAKGKIVVARNQENSWTADVTELQDDLDRETTRAQQVALADPVRIRTNNTADARVSIPQIAVGSEQAFSTFLASLKTEVVPEWQWQVQCGVRSAGMSNGSFCNEVVILTEFLNATKEPPNHPNIEPYLFDTQAEYILNGGEVVPFELELAPRSFRYDRRLWGRGFNCGVVPPLDEASAYTTTHTPQFAQPRLITRGEPKASFQALATDPVTTLAEIYTQMKAYKLQWLTGRQGFVAADSSWQDRFGDRFDQEALLFEAEIARFKVGCQLIRTNADVRSAFQLTNEVFYRLGVGQNRDSWRLFQIVFLVSQIHSMADLASPSNEGNAERETVDIIYFPTGGGKTEAYLGVIVFHCFFDRLRGKLAGVTAWTRFPLRLLTLQQTQRVADVIGVAELVRREQEDVRLSGTNVDGFAVGYFVGEGGSPNELDDPDRYQYADSVTWSKARDPQARQTWKRVVRCPSCRTTVNIEFVPENSRLIHRCTNANCKFQDRVIPVYIVDNEVYRYLPSVIVGTIDKLAGLGNQRKLAQVFGRVDGRCNLHGYYKGKCCQRDCNDPRMLRKGIPVGLSGPTLFVQDELHLLKEGLGTFDAHYETFVHRLRREFGQTEPLKIIASSATIEAFERQVEHLYGRDTHHARIFPGPGPTIGESFYARNQDYPQRVYVGIIPHNKTIDNAILELIEEYHRQIQTLQRLPSGSANPFGGDLSPGSTEWLSLLDLYCTSLTYFAALPKLNSTRADLESHVNPILSREGLSHIELSELTGGTSTDEVAKTLDRISNRNDHQEAVLATNMVSHGVDIDRLNGMIFYGMPRQTAEYIQASSRVGRSHVGVVFTCLHPARERDWSHYTYFAKYHEYLGQLVEPVAINRWSVYSIDRTLPGLFMAVLLQVIANSSTEPNPQRYYMRDFINQKIMQGSLRPDDFIPFLKDAYLVSAATTAGELEFSAKIEQRIRQFFDFILASSSSNNMVSDALIPKPMNSLRDVDEMVEIQLDSTGSDWSTR